MFISLKNKSKKKIGMKRFKLNKTKLCKIPYSIVVNEIFKYIVFECGLGKKLFVYHKRYKFGNTVLCKNPFDFFGYFKRDRFRKIWFFAKNVGIYYNKSPLAIRREIIYLDCWNIKLPNLLQFEGLVNLKLSLIKLLPKSLPKRLTHLTLCNVCYVPELPIGLTHLRLKCIKCIFDLSNHKGLTHLECIHIENILNLPRGLTHLGLVHIKGIVGHFPRGLTHLTLCGVETIPELPKGLINLKFSDPCFYVPDLLKLERLIHLTLNGVYFDNISFPEGLTHLKMFNIYNDFVDITFNIPAKITHLTLNNSDFCPDFPKGLTHLKLKDVDFDGELPKGLIHLELCGMNLPPLLPVGLIHLSLDEVNIMDKSKFIGIKNVFINGLKI